MGYSSAFSQSLFVMLFVADKVAKGLFEFISTQQIAETLNIPASTTGMILRQLNRVGLIETREGASGGVRLARPPEEITILDIFTAMEQERPLFQTNFQAKVAGETPSKAQAAILQVLENARDALRENLRGVTVRDLMDAIQ